jgi:hypothetical protein
MVSPRPYHHRACHYLWSLPGKYVGNRPVKLKKADNAINPVEIGHRKARQLEKELKKNRKKPY